MKNSALEQKLFDQALLEKLRNIPLFIMVELTPEELGRTMANGWMGEVGANHRQTEDGLAAMAGGQDYVKRAQASLDHGAHLDRVEAQQHDQEIGFEGCNSQKTSDSENFEEAVKPLMKWLADNACPHSHIVVSATNAELFHGVKSFGSFEFVKD